MVLFDDHVSRRGRGDLLDRRWILHHGQDRIGYPSVFQINQILSSWLLDHAMIPDVGSNHLVTQPGPGHGNDIIISGLALDLPTESIFDQGPITGLGFIHPLPNGRSGDSADNAAKRRPAERASARRVTDRRASDCPGSGTH